MAKDRHDGTLSEELTALCPSKCPEEPCDCDRQLTVILNVLVLVNGPYIAEVANDMCPHIGTCPECLITDFAHEDDCKLIALARRKCDSLNLPG